MFALTDDVPEAANLFAHAAALLDGRDPRELVRTATSEVLHHNRTGQILCTLEALAAATALRSALPDKVVIAGYSVGEVAGWGVAGVLTQTDTLDLVTRRAEAMDAASSAGEGMLFVRGLSRQSVDRLCAQHDAAVAIVNPGDAFVVGGTLAALDALAREAQFMHAARVVAVPVEVASHTPRLAKASMKFREILSQVAVTFPPTGSTRLLSGIDGSAVVDAKGGLDKLAAQISRTVQWADCLQCCIEAGATCFLELGPGSALSEMAAGAYRDIPARSLDEFKTLQGAQSWLVRQGYSG